MCSLAVQLPAKVSDGLSSSVFLLLSFRLISIPFFSTQASCSFTIFFAAQSYLRLFLHQGRDFFAQLSFVIFVLREEFAFLFQTFSRNDPPGKAPPSRGRSVFKKRKKKKGNASCSPSEGVPPVYLRKSASFNTLKK